jgi:hypothetical protein
LAGDILVSGSSWLTGEPAAAQLYRSAARILVRWMKFNVAAADEFDYPVGPLGWHNGGFGWAGPWTDLDSRSGPDDSSTNAVAEGSLAGSDLVPEGNRAIQTGNFNRIRRLLSTSMRGVFDVAGLLEDQDGLHLVGKNGKVVYLSFMQRVSHVNDVYYGFELHRGDGNANRVLSIGHGAEGTSYAVASNFNTLWRQLSDTPLFASLGEEDTVAHLFVVRIEFGAGNRDVATIYRDPASLIDEERCEPTATLRGNLAFDRISLANFDSLRGQVHEVDEIRVGTSFTAVTGQRSRKELPLTDALTSKTASLRRTTILLPAITPLYDRNAEQSPQATGNQPNVLFSRGARWHRSASGHVWLSNARGKARRFCEGALL